DPVTGLLASVSTVTGFLEVSSQDLEFRIIGLETYVRDGDLESIKSIIKRFYGRGYNKGICSGITSVHKESKQKNVEIIPVITNTEKSTNEDDIL
ncbi:6759_t:CDS:2, partial [Cetraspora pellucida]